MEFTWKEIMMTVFGGGGMIALLIQFLNLFFSRYDQKKKKKAELEEKQTHLSIESRKLDLAEEDRAREEPHKLLAEKKERIEELQKEVNELKNVETLSRPIIKQIYAAMRDVRRAVTELDLQILRREKYDVIAAQMEIVRAKLDELEKQLP